MRIITGELTLVTGPASEPITTAEAKSHLRVDFADDDTLIAALVTAARQMFEELNGRALFTQTWKLTLDRWPASGRIELPRPPLVSVTSIKYIDSAGVESTFSSGDYVVETGRTPGRVSLGYDKSWPTATLRPASPITITYVAGWTTTAAIPERYKAAIKLLVGHWYENREAIITSGAMPKALPLGFESIVLMDRV